ncbi:MAG: hypothetical protein ACRCYV_09440 [Aeromonas sp.]
MKKIFLLASLLFGNNALAARDDFYGDWLFDSNVARAIYFKLSVSKTHISWPKTDNYPHGCRSEYDIVPDANKLIPGVNKPDDLDYDILRNITDYHSEVIELNNPTCQTLRVLGFN